MVLASAEKRGWDPLRPSNVSVPSYRPRQRGGLTAVRVPVRSRCGGVDERPRTRGDEDMFVSLAGCAVDIRPLRVHVPAFPDSYLPGVYSITESRTVYL